MPPSQGGERGSTPLTRSASKWTPLAAKRFRFWLTALSFLLSIFIIKNCNQFKISLIIASDSCIIAHMANIEAQKEPTPQQTEKALYYADHMSKGATTLRSKHEPKLPAIHPDEIIVGYAGEDYPRSL
jgi:hypothetical protein